MRPSAIAVCLLLAVSAAGCRSKEAVVDAAATRISALTRTDSLMRTLVMEAASDSASETAVIEFFPPDSSGRQALRRVTAKRSRHSGTVRAASQELAEAHTAVRDSIGSDYRQERRTRSAPLPQATHIAAAVCFILLILTILKLRKQS